MHYDALSDTDLLLAYCRILDHIRKRELPSAGGNPIAGYAELLAAERLGLQRETDEAIDFDAQDSDTGDTYQIKHSLNPKSTPRSGTIKNLEDRPFDFLVYLIFNLDLTVREAWKIPYDAVCRHARYSDRNRAHYISLTNNIRQSPDVKDISAIFD